MKSDPGGIRTHDPQLRRLLLYPTELRNHRHFVRLGRKMLRKGNQKLIIHNPFAENSLYSEAKKSSFGGGVSQNPQKQPCLRRIVSRLSAFCERVIAGEFV